jgi:Signal transduction histidine kinase
MDTDNKVDDDIYKQFESLKQELCFLKLSFSKELDERKEIEFALKERLKELNCHNQIAELMANHSLSPFDAIKKIVQIIPPSWQFPEIAQASVTINGELFQTSGFKKSNYSLSQEIKIKGVTVGLVEVCYPEDLVPKADLIFLPEETNLLFSIAVKIGNFIERSEKITEIQTLRENFRNSVEDGIKKARILIVDDQEANIDVLVGLLEMQGYENIKATQDSRETFRLYYTFKPDLILLDLSMPYLSGFDVMNQLKELLPANVFLPILVLTADATPQAKQNALSGGAIDFLTKPFDLVEVGLRIKNLLYTSYLHKQLINQNHLLENKVKERTQELEQQNIELIIAKEKAEASDRLKSEFINNISHEIRTPLNGILGFGEILTEENLSPDERKSYSEMLNQSSGRLINTVTNIMDIALLSSGNQKVIQKEFNVESQINFVVSQFLHSSVEKGLSLIFTPPTAAEQITVISDSTLFAKILYQIIDNAVKFTSKGTIGVGFEVNGDNLSFFVKDTGIGISEEKQIQIFESFIQEDNTKTRKYEGNGLGLTIAKGFVELLNGKIWLSSEKGKGSTFYFSLPYQRRESIAESEKQQKPITGRRTILVAEDDDANFLLIRAILSNSPVDLLHAEDGIQAIELSMQHPEISVVLMDVRMPDIDGLEATKKIKSFRPRLPVIVVTAYSDMEDRKMAFDAGCDDFLTKPINKNILINKLEEFGIL